MCVRTDSARHFFEDARAASQDAERCRRELGALESNAKRLPPTSFEARVRGTKTDVMAAKVGRLVDREAVLWKRIEANYRTIAMASKVLYGPEEDGEGGLCEHLSSLYADIVWHRFLADLPWKQVAARVNLSIRPCQRMCGTALEVIDEHNLLATVSVNA